MTDVSSGARTKKTPRDSDDSNEEDNEEGNERAAGGDTPRVTKAKRHDIAVPEVSDVDMKLAEKLDNLLRISDRRKPRFFPNKPNQQPISDNNTRHDDATSPPPKDLDKSKKLVRKNLTKEELRERLLKKYETLVPELDPERPQVKLIKVLSAKDSLELAKGEAKKQLEHQLELRSVSGNRLAHSQGTGSFKFNDGYELPAKCFLPGAKRTLDPTQLRARQLDQQAAAAADSQAKSANDSSDQEPSEDEHEVEAVEPPKKSNGGRSVTFSDAANETHIVSRHAGSYGYMKGDSEDEDENFEDPEGIWMRRVARLFAKNKARKEAADAAAQSAEAKESSEDEES